MADLSKKNFDKVIKEMLHEQNTLLAEWTAPVYTLEEILAFKKTTVLRELGKGIRVKYYGKLRREELIAGISETLQREHVLRGFLTLLDENEMNFFDSVALKKHLIIKAILPDFYFQAIGLGLMQSFYHEDKLYFVVPKEIRSVYKKLLKTDFPEEKAFSELLHNYATAAVSLYGIISMEDLVALFNSQNERQTTLLELSTNLLTYVIRSYGYVFWEDYIMSVDLLDDDYQSAEELLKVRDMKPRYSPPREEFLRYADWTYYEETPEITALTHYLLKRLRDPDAVMAFVDEVHDMIIAGVRMEEYIDLLDEADINFKGVDEAKEFYDLLTGVMNNTRIWWNHGHTPNEIANLMAAGKPPMKGQPVTASPKINRNDPCPCGSGKKYKQCCGK